jgi:hypothetical protein
MGSVSDIRELVLDTDPMASDPGCITCSGFLAFIVEECRAALHTRCDRLIEESGICDRELMAELHATFRRTFDESLLKDLGVAVAELQLRVARHRPH